jgi:glutamine synthetase
MQADMAMLYRDINDICSQHDIHIADIGAERGHEQHEVSLLPCNDPIKTAHDTERLKQIITDCSRQRGITPDFSAKPWPSEPGSGLHIHLHLADCEGKNLFYKDDETISEVLKFSIGGMLQWLPDSFAVFAPYVQSYDRFVPGSNTPVTASWGANNRTVAIRLPDSNHDNKHIEHRVAGADAPVAPVIAVLLAAMHYGIAHKNEPGPQIYGDAALAMYNLPPFFTTLEDAQAAFHTSSRISDYFSRDIIDSLTDSGLLPVR